MARRITLYALLAFSLASATYGSYSSYRWVKTRVDFYNNAAGYLFDPTDVVDENGNRVTRAQLLDAVLKAAVAKSPGLHFVK